MNGFTKKLVTVGKVLKRSLKWDQSGISSIVCSKVTSKTRLIVQDMGLKKIAGMVGERSFPKTCSSSTNPCHGECKPSLMLGEPTLVIRIQ